MLKNLQLLTCTFYFLCSAFKPLKILMLDAYVLIFLPVYVVLLGPVNCACTIFVLSLDANLLPPGHNTFLDA